jgi:hypothetical protein
MTESTKHDRIFMQICDEISAFYCEGTWSLDRIHEEDVEYIRADIVAEQLAEKQQDLQTTEDALGHAYREIEHLTLGLENCRLFAARHRKEDWALLILGFCAEAGVVGSMTR